MSSLNIYLCTSCRKEFLKVVFTRTTFDQELRSMEAELEEERRQEQELYSTMFQPYKVRPFHRGNVVRLVLYFFASRVADPQHVDRILPFSLIRIRILTQIFPRLWPSSCSAPK
jgi:hypothetical protein